MSTMEPRKELTEDRKSDQIIRKVSSAGIFGNIALTAFKLFAGIFGRSGAMVSDAVHSLSDVVATLIALIGVKISRKQADAGHPYGHERFECIASMILGILLAVTGIGIGWAGLETVISGAYLQAGAPGLIALIAAVVSIAVKETMFRYTRHYAKILNSAAFMADAWHHRSDALSSIGSLIGIGGAMLGFPVLDSVASVVICAMILKTAIDVLKDALNKLLDTSAGDMYEKKLTAYIEKEPEVVCVDVLRSRMFGNKVYVDLEIQVDGSKSLREAHAVAEQVHRNVERDFPNVKHIMIHVNPAGE